MPSDSPPPSLLFAPADTSGGSWSQDACDAAPTVIDGLQAVKDLLDPNGWAYGVVNTAQQAIIDGYISNCTP